MNQHWDWLGFLLSPFPQPPFLVLTSKPYKLGINQLHSTFTFRISAWLEHLPHTGKEFRCYEGKNEKASSCQESNLQLSNHSRTITILYMYGKVVLKASVTHYVAARCETEVCSDSNCYVSSRLMTMAFIALPCMRSI